MFCKAAVALLDRVRSRDQKYTSADFDSVSRRVDDGRIIVFCQRCKIAEPPPDAEQVEIKRDFGLEPGAYQCRPNSFGILLRARKRLGASGVIGYDENKGTSSFTCSGWKKWPRSQLRDIGNIRRLETLALCDGQLPQVDSQFVQCRAGPCQRRRAHQ